MGIVHFHIVYLKWYSSLIMVFYNTVDYCMINFQGRKMVKNERMLDLVVKLTSLLLQVKVSVFPCS